jgi:RHH-type transcriptional regulator, rel operon repressor / antitoxin RelB
MLAIRFPPEIEERLEKLAKLTGRTKTFYAREAILEHIEDLEDYYLAARVAKRVAEGKEGTVPMDDVERMIGVDD